MTSKAVGLLSCWARCSQLYHFIWRFEMGRSRFLEMFIMCAALSDDIEFGIQNVPNRRKPETPRKNNAKKCKSCVHYSLGGYKGRCCLDGRMFDPLHIACDSYSKRKK